MKYPVCLTIFLCLAVLLAACSTPPPLLEYQGVSTTMDATHIVTLSLREPTAAGVTSGTYYSGVARGILRGTVADTILNAELKPSPDCTYTFTGVLTETALTGSFEPSDCPGGQPGDWNLNRL